MKKIITIFVLLYGFCIDNTFGQTPNYLFKDSNTPFIANLKISPFSITNTSSLNFPNLFKDGYTPTILNLNQIEVAKIKKSDVFIELSIPSNSKSELVLELVQVDFWGPDFKVVDGNGSPIAFEKGLYYHGRIKGDNNSMVALSISKSEIAGLITDKNGSRSLGKIKDQSQYSLSYDNQFKDNKNFDCSVTEGSSTPIPFSQLQPQAVVACKAVGMYIETDYSVFQNFNNDVQATTNWANTLFNQVALLYRNDNIGVYISQMKVWTTPDPYASATTTSAFVNTFHNNVYTNYTGNLAQVFSMRSLGGGIAYDIGGICNKPNSQSVSASLSQYYNSLPYYSWNVNVVTHEFGHSFGSRHTHACVWNGNGTAIDGCGPTYTTINGNLIPYEGNCCCAPIPSSGTIMSYCHWAPGGINLLNGFGPQPGNYIRNIVNNCSQIAVNNASPTNLTSYSIGLTSATISWNVPVTSTNFTVSYRRVGESSFTTISVGAVNNYTFSGLYTGTQYEWTVLGDCSAESTYPYAYFTTTTNLALSFANFSESKCPGNNTLTFSPNGIINPDTQVQLELSNANGSFDTPIVLGTQSLASTGSSISLSFVLPFNVSAGTGYKIRLKTNSPNVISTAINFEIKPSQPNPQYTYSSPSLFCNTNPITVSVINCTGTVTWYSPTFNEQTGLSVNIIPSDGLYVSSVCSGNNLCSSQNINTQVFKKINTGTQNSVLIWEKSFGGTANDQFRNIAKTADGGYLLTGYSFSGLNGNKTQPQRGAGDGMLIKIDANGNRLWEKAFGGINEDILFDILPTSDNNFLIVGQSFSGIGYEKQSINKGHVDAWVIKISTNGDVIWEVSLGSTAGEYTGKVAPTSDGGFIIVSSVASIGPASVIANGDRSQNLKNESWDYWVFKIDANGQKVWDKIYGGLTHEFVGAIEKATDNSGYYLVGQTNSASGASSDLTTSARHDYDGWLLKIDNNGNKIFDKIFSGGTARSPFTSPDFSNESLRTIKALPDGNYLIQGFSNNHAGNEKSENSMGGLDMWLIKIAPDGTKISDKVFGGTNNEYEGDMIVLNDGSILLSSSSKSTFNVDRNAALKGTSDIWMLKLDPNLNIVWNENFGGAVGNDPAKQETIYKILDDGNNNFILIGWADEAKGDRADAFGLDDGWVMKINIPSISKPTISANTTLVCPGESITLTVSGCTSNILWSNGATTNSVIVTPNSNDNTYKVNCITNANTCIGLDSEVFRVNVAPNDLNLIGIAVTGNKQAKGNIISKEIINSGVNVNYKAGKSILLDKNQSFEAKSGSIFKAEIAACAIENGLLARYDFSNNILDQSGNNRNGLVNTALFTKDRFGNSNSALSFNGVNQYVTLGNWFNYQEFTVSFWLNAGSTQANAYAMLIDNNHTGSRSWFAQQDNTNNNSYIFGVLGSASGGVAFNLTSTWNHLTFVKGAGFVKVFLNGKLVSTATHGGSIPYDGTQNLILGAWYASGGFTRFWNGKMDDLKLYNRALSDTEITTIFRAEAPNPSLSSGLFSNYKFDGDANDVSGKGNNGTVIGGATFTTDRFGQANKALNFDGVDDHMSVPNNNTLSGFNELTMSAWVNHNQTTGVLGSIITKWYQQSGQDTYWMGIKSDTKVGAYTNNDVNTGLESSIPINTWTHIIFTHNSSGDKLFINGSLVASNNISGTILSSTQNLLIGADSNLGTLWRFYKGKMDDVKLYNRALSPLEVIQLYDLEKP